MTRIDLPGNFTRRQFCVGLAGLGLATGCGSGNSAPPRFSADTVRQLDKAVTDKVQADNLPSAVVGVWVPGQGEYTTAQGKANLATSEMRNIQNPFRIASITKTFTATAILQLVDAGKLSTSDKLARWYPDFPNANIITVDNLLRMRSGIIDSAGTEFISEYFANPTTPLTPADMIARSAALGKDFTTPDEKTIYTNVNFILLASIVEKVSGQAFSLYIRDKIVRPLNLKNTFYATDNNLPGSLHGYCAGADGVLTDKTVLNPAPAGGAGAIISTLQDLRVYAKALATGTLLKPATQATRLIGQTIDGDPAIVQYAQGLAHLGKYYGHNGTIFGFSSEMWYLPEKEATIVVNVNRLDADDQSKSFALFAAVSEILFPDALKQ